MAKLSFARKLIAAAACAAAIISPAQAADKTYRLKLAETWPTNFGVFSTPARRMAELAEGMSKRPPADRDRYGQQAQIGVWRIRHGPLRAV